MFFFGALTVTEINSYCVIIYLICLFHSTISYLFENRGCVFLVLLSNMPGTVDASWLFVGLMSEQVKRQRVKFQGYLQKLCCTSLVQHMRRSRKRAMSKAEGRVRDR